MYIIRQIMYCIYKSSSKKILENIDMYKTVKFDVSGDLWLSAAEDNVVKMAFKKHFVIEIYRHNIIKSVKKQTKKLIELLV